MSELGERSAADAGATDSGAPAPATPVTTEGYRDYVLVSSSSARSSTSSTARFSRS
jgi:hypothetical protein